jgi:hypothetical protein
MVDVTIIETRTVPIPEPDWCIDPHDGTQHFTDLTHNGPETTASVNTALGSITFFRAKLSHAPYLEIQPDPYPQVAVDLDLQSVFEADELPNLARALRAAADLLDQLGTEALRLRGGQA